jgi:gamma-glutamylcyclotransferase (GGCT)/AIG2-like uncharacterized protein YtfP
MENTTYIFTYGTLMQNRSNHSMLDREGIKYIGDATLEGYSLFDVEGAHFPAIMQEDGYTVSGEVYEVPKEMIRILDSFEGVPYLYERKMDIARTAIEVGDVLVSFYISTPKTSTYDRLTRCIRCGGLSTVGVLTEDTMVFNKWQSKRVIV